MAEQKCLFCHISAGEMSADILYRDERCLAIRDITPQAPVHALVIPLTLIGSFRVFGQVYVMTQGGPEGATRTLLQYIYETGFREFYMGRASAAAVILLLITLSLTLFQLKVLRQV